MSAITPVEMQAVAQVHAPRECLTFRIGAEDYGMEMGPSKDGLMGEHHRGEQETHFRADGDRAATISFI